MVESSIDRQKSTSLPIAWAAIRFIMTLSVNLAMVATFGARVYAADANTADSERHDSVIAQIKGSLQTQTDAWNRGDIDAFMQTYWKSPDLTFSSQGQITRGWQQTLDNYKKRYPTAEQMGRVEFSDLEVTLLGSDAALVLGRWHLQRANDPLQGNFTLVFRKIDTEWLIIHDHTSREIVAEK